MADAIPRYIRLLLIRCRAPRRVDPLNFFYPCLPRRSSRPPRELSHGYERIDRGISLRSRNFNCASNSSRMDVRDYHKFRATVSLNRSVFAFELGRFCSPGWCASASKNLHTRNTREPPSYYRSVVRVAAIYEQLFNDKGERKGMAGYRRTQQGSIL